MVMGMSIGYLSRGVEPLQLQGGGPKQEGKRKQKITNKENEGKGKKRSDWARAPLSPEKKEKKRDYRKRKKKNKSV